jgi:hypothetical protein
MMYMCSEKFNLDSLQLSSLEKSPIESSQETLEEKEALKAIDEDFDPISDEEEITYEAIEGHDVAGEGADRFDIVVTESSPVNDHEQEVSEEEHDDEGPLLPPQFMQSNDRFQKRSSGRTTSRLADCRVTKCIRAGLVKNIMNASFSLQINANIKHNRSKSPTG